MRDRLSVDMTMAIGPGMAEMRQTLLAARGNLDPLLAGARRDRALRRHPVGPRPRRT